jgi:NADH-quinone oxidoreductase subunit C
MAANKQEEARSKSPTREKARQIHATLTLKFGDLVELVDAVDPFTVIKDPARLVEVMKFMREDSGMEMDFLRSIAGVDWPDESIIESVYHLFSYRHGHGHTLKVRLPRAAPEVASVEGIWATANWFERETFDLFGVIYLGHSDLRRIMLPDDWIGHPLRKDYVEAEDYHGIGTTRASPLEAFKQMDVARKKARDEKGIVVEQQKSPIRPPEGWVKPGKKGAAEEEEEAAE